MKTAAVTGFRLAFLPAAAFLFACSEQPAIDYGKVSESKGADGASCEVRQGTGHAYDVFCADTLAGYLDNGADGADGASGKDGADGASCEVRQGTEHAYDVFCADTLAGYLDNGTDGVDGKDGADGEGCSVSPAGEGDPAGYDLKVTCGEGESVGYLRNGADGEEGEAGDKGDAGEKGADCSVSKADDGVHALMVTCGEDPPVYLNNGADGASGTDCAVSEGMEHAFDVFCANSLIGYLDNGADGEGCSVSAADDGEHDLAVTCGGVVAGYLNNGADGAAGEAGATGSSGSQGLDGVDGADGARCWNVDSGNYNEIWCGTSSSSSKSAEFPKALCGTSAYDPATHFCDVANSYTVAPLCGGGSYNTVAQYCAKKSEGDIIGEYGTPLVDSRDGKTYKTIQIGSQIWMAENLNYIPANNDELWAYRGYNDMIHSPNYSFCYNDSESNCAAYGRLYTWDVAMYIPQDGAIIDCIHENNRGVCPIGWHMPSTAEWGILINYVGEAEAAAGTNLKSISGWDGGNGTNEYGFSALPGGKSDNKDASNGIGSQGYWWTASSPCGTYYNISSSEGVSSGQYNIVGGYYRIPHQEVQGLSVRCVKNPS